MFAAGGGNRFLAPVVGVEIDRMTVDDGVPQLRSASHCRVLGEVALNSRDRCILDVLRGGEVGLAGAEVDHVDALLAQLVGLGDHGHGGRRLNAVDAVGELHGNIGFRNWGHPRFLDFDSLADCSLMAGSSFSRSRCSTNSGTKSLTEPPSCATSRTSRELR